MPRRKHHENGGVLQGIFAKVSANEWLEFAAAQKGKLIQEIEHLGKQMVEKIVETPILANRDRLFSFFSIPSRRDLDRLQRRLQKIETRLDTLQKPQSPH